MMRIRHLTTYLLVIAALAGCALRPSEREMNFLASALTKLSAAVDATARYGQLPADATGADLLTAATADDLGLVAPFSGYTIRVQRSGRFSSILICDRQGANALLEDAGCTAKLDEHRWSAPSPQRCEFTLNLNAVCAR
jgi:hypothetical protein